MCKFCANIFKEFRNWNTVSEVTQLYRKRLSNVIITSQFVANHGIHEWRQIKSSRFFKKSFIKLLCQEKGLGTKRICKEFSNKKWAFSAQYWHYELDLSEGR